MRRNSDSKKPSQSQNQDIYFGIFYSTVYSIKYPLQIPRKCTTWPAEYQKNPTRTVGGRVSHWQDLELTGKNSFRVFVWEVYTVGLVPAWSWTGYSNCCFGERCWNWGCSLWQFLLGHPWGRRAYKRIYTVRFVPYTFSCKLHNVQILSFRGILSQRPCAIGIVCYDNLSWETAFLSSCLGTSFMYLGNWWLPFIDQSSVFSSLLPSVIQTPYFLRIFFFF